MNIFVVSPNQKECAKYLDDARLRKMIVETAQMLCTTNFVHGIDAPYKPTHTNHPCTKWVRTCFLNYHWTVGLLEEYLTEYEYRFKKTHRTEAVLSFIHTHYLTMYSRLPFSYSRTPFVNCTKNFKHIKNVHEAYKLELEHKWRHDKICVKITIDI